MRRVICQSLLALVAATFAAHSSKADGLSFSLHSGHYYDHCYDPCWGPHCGFSVWAPPPPRYVYVAPPPVIQERIYVQPPVQERVIIQQQAPIISTTTSQSRAIASNPLPAPPTRAASTGAPIVIGNSNDRGATVAFLINQKSEEVGDGQTRTYAGSSQVIEFDRGGNFGTARYELTGGLYSFTVSNEGWELVRESNLARTADRPAVRKNELPISVGR